MEPGITRDAFVPWVIYAQDRRTQTEHLTTIQQTVAKIDSRLEREEEHTRTTVRRFHVIAGAVITALSTVSATIITLYLERLVNH